MFKRETPAPADPRVGFIVCFPSSSEVSSDGIPSSQTASRLSATPDLKTG